MKVILIFLLFIALSHAQVTFVAPYQTQCPGFDAQTYEKTFPCSWNNYLMVWDMQPSKFICDNVSSLYTFNYSIINNDPNNIQPFSVALWDDLLIDSENTAGLYVPLQYTEEQYNNWYSALPELRFNSQYIIQPVNTPNSNDFSGNNQIVTNTLLSVSRTKNNGVVLYINRENLTSQFNCFNLTISFNIF